MSSKEKRPNPPQSQDQQPGHESEMRPRPVFIRDDYRGSGKLEGRVALISGGDSGIGRAVAVHFAREGADVAIIHLEENEDARETRRLVEAEGRRCHVIRTDLSKAGNGRKAVSDTVSALGALDILVNNAGEQHESDSPAELDRAQIEQTFATNLFACFELVDAALPHLKKGSSIISTGSITGARGHETLLDYAATKGAIHAMTFSFAQSLAKRGIRVNAVAPGPIWTPLIPASFDADKVAKFGADTPMGRPGQPAEVAPAYVLLASEDGAYITGQVIHINGGGYMGD
ncbi:SDR family oxidoreductase [Pseudofulvimonas gallinarii]|jgi:NAD(P)-dependent dehydrogenase (short-subunit alcohol dehydrogenase family)|uniref:NAD(P)-dependent dehydrogenase (Short-subunit alcohol dehydrogenase family) n=1 Tax=Pseudofulvimonas gallinarii TaxID=634155 RepID=A0A4S3KWN8_9GAMM|nr:SDR family oxidoreductase [Pseudofulvimonas gallinarii]TCT00107.1 NAD(P)-dependent dehydrogenase (short-subunit alcohol dehydrogenase family) [Pseudofulvimonas gallinarii]THD13576.1 NAD(P)-dependent oxidoreductase [Pseudofulvimonas gallinarii]